MNLINTVLVNSPNPDHYSITDGIVRDRIDLTDAFKLCEQDPIWANRGRAIQSYATLEQSLCRSMADFGNMERESATTVFYKITSTAARNSILEKLVRKKHGARFNLFWNSYLKQLRQIDLRRNEIVHWLSALHVALDANNKMLVGVTLIQPSSIDSKDTAPLTSKDLVTFTSKCDAFASHCDMFLGVTSGQIYGPLAEPWHDIFQRPLEYPLPATHPLNKTPATPDIPPEASRA